MNNNNFSTNQSKITTTDDELAEQFQKLFPYIKYGHGEFWEYRKTDGCYKKLIKVVLNQKIITVLKRNKKYGLKPNEGRINSLTTFLESLLYVEEKKWIYHPNLINCINGVLNINTLQLVDHKPEDYFTYCYQYKYDPSAQCPHFLSIFKNLPKSDIDCLQEFCGYCLTEETKYEKALFIIGDPGSGKTTFSESLKSVFGVRAISLGLRDLISSNFNISLLINKTLSISTEQPKYTNQNIDLLKNLISGEEIIANIKYVHPFPFRPIAKFIFAMNDFPQFTNGHTGLERRILLLEFPPIPVNQRDPNLIKKIQKEKSGILNWLLIGLNRLNSRENFLIPDSISRRSTEYFRNENYVITHLRKFIKEECVVDNSFRVKSSEIYNHFTNWGVENNVPHISTTKFSQLMESLSFSKIKNNNIEWVGIKINYQREDREDF